MAGLVTWQLSCTLLLTGQAAVVGQEKVYSQSSTALMNMGLEFCGQRTERCQQGTFSTKRPLTPRAASLQDTTYGLWWNLCGVRAHLGKQRVKIRSWDFTRGLTRAG